MASRKPKTIAFWCGNLPHWEVEGGRYFVTLHLAGAIPPAGMGRIRRLSQDLEQLSRTNPEARLQVQRNIFAEMERWLDRAEHHCYFRIPVVSELVCEALEHRRGQPWTLYEYVVMRNHLHLFFEFAKSSSLRSSLEQFKRWTGHQAGKHIDLAGKPFWQDEWFDHWSRSDEEDDRIIAYIRNNPVKAKLVEKYTDWPYGSWSQK